MIIQQSLSGLGEVRWRGRTWPVPPGHALLGLVPERLNYYYPRHATEPWRFAWINIYGELGRHLCRALREAHGPVMALPLGSELSNRFQKFAQAAHDRVGFDPHFMTQSVCSFLLDWNRLLQAAPNKNADAAATAMRICETRFREPLTVSRLAEMVEVSREHLSRTFHDQFGVSPATFLRQVRLKAALNVLSSPHATQKEAAFSTGFPSVQALQRALRSAK